MKLNNAAKKIILLTLMLFVYCTGFSQSVIIHHIGVGQGDATLILLTSPKGEHGSILIDAGNSKSKGDTVFSVLNHYLHGLKRLDVVIVSHLHSDHMGGMTEVYTRLQAAGYRVGYIFDRSALGQNNGDDELCYDNKEYAENDEVAAIPSSLIVKKYREAVKSLEGGPTWLNLTTGINILNYCFNGKFDSTGMVFRSLTSNGYVSKSEANYGDKTDVASGSKLENDLSYSFLLEMGQFKYFTGGDIGGESPYADLETPLVNYFNTRADAKTFHFCAYKASHHGSSHSTNATFIARTVPTVNVVPSALRSFSGTQLPGKSTILRIDSSSTNRFLYFTYTFEHNPWSGKVGYYNDVIISVNGANYSTNHKMVIYQQRRDRSDLSLVAGVMIDTAKCTKQH